MGAVSWVVGVWVALLFTLVALMGCAPLPATKYDWAADEAFKRVNFNSRNNWYKRDYTPVPAGEQRWGNCATFAATAVSILKERGVDAAIGECNSYWGPHAFAVVIGQGFVIDSVHRTAVPFSEMGCR